MDSRGLHSEEGGLEESLRASEPFVPNGDDLSVRELVGLFEGGGAGRSSHFLVKVKGDVAELLLDVTDNFSLGSGRESVATLSEDLHEVVSKVTAGQVQSKDGMGKGITLKERAERVWVSLRKYDFLGQEN